MTPQFADAQSSTALPHPPPKRVTVRGLGAPAGSLFNDSRGRLESIIVVVDSSSLGLASTASINAVGDTADHLLQGQFAFETGLRGYAASIGCDLDALLNRAAARLDGPIRTVPILSHGDVKQLVDDDFNTPGL